MANEMIRIDVEAKDSASKILDKVAKSAGDLERLSPEVLVEADDRASADLDQVIARTTALDGDTAKVILEAEASKAQGEIRQTSLMLGQVDGETAEAVLTARDNASARLEKIQSALRDVDGRKAEIEVTADTSNAERGFGKLSGFADKLPGPMGEAAGAAEAMAGSAAGLSAGLAAAGAVAIELANSYAEGAQAAATLAQLTGATVEESSQLSQVWSNTGADVKDLQDVMLQVNGVLSQSPQLAADLGIEGENVQERFLSAVDAVRGIEDPLKRATLMSQLFGEEGARQVGAIISVTDDLGAAVNDVDPLFDDEDVAKAQDYQRTMNELKASVSELAAAVGEGLVPTLQTLGELAGPVVAILEKLPSVNPEGFFDFAFGLLGIEQQSSKTRGEVEKTTGSIDEQSGAMQRQVAHMDTLLERQRSWLNYQLQIAGGNLGLEASFDAVGDAVGHLAEEQVNADATSESLEDAQRGVNQAVLDAQNQVVGYVSELGTIPPDIKTAILAQIPPGMRADFEAFMARAERGVTVPVAIDAHLTGASQDLFRTVGLPTPRSLPPTAPAPPVASPYAGTTNVVVNMPRGARATDVIRVLNRHARRNGGRPARS